MFVSIERVINDKGSFCAYSADLNRFKAYLVIFVWGTRILTCSLLLAFFHYFQCRYCESISETSRRSGHLSWPRLQDKQCCSNANICFVGFHRTYFAFWLIYDTPGILPQSRWHGILLENTVCVFAESTNGNGSNIGSRKTVNFRLDQSILPSVNGAI